MRALQAVAVGTEYAEIFEAIVAAISIDVIELDGNAPVGRSLGPTAQLTCFRLEPCPKQPSLELAGVRPAVRDENLLERFCDRFDVSAFDIPTTTEKMRRIERELEDSSLDLNVVAAGGNETELANRLAKASRGPDGGSQALIGPARSFQEMRRVEAERGDPLTNPDVLIAVSW